MTNSGAHGVTPNYVLQARKNYYNEIETNPDLHYRINHEPYYDIRKEIVSKAFNTSSLDFSLVENASEAINSILKSLTYKAGDILLIYDTAYRMVEEVCRQLEEKYQVQLLIIKTNPKALNSGTELVNLAEEQIKKYGNKIRIAIVDHVASFPALVFPIKDLVKLFKENNILCLVDGAHAFGQVDLDLTDLDPDLYVANFHKWGFGAKSSSLLYVKKEYQSLIYPAVISHSYKASFPIDFKFLGTRDYSPIYALKETTEFMEAVDMERVKKYNHELAVKVGQEVSKIWGTEQLVHEESMIGAMVLIELPEQSADVEKKLGLEFCEKYNTFVKIGKYQGKYYVRFCAQIFNELDDYIYVANAIKDTLNSK